MEFSLVDPSVEAGDRETGRWQALAGEGPAFWAELAPVHKALLSTQESQAEELHNQTCTLEGSLGLQRGGEIGGRKSGSGKTS